MSAAVVILSFGSVESGRAATGLPPGFQDVPVVSGLSSPTAMDFAPDGRLFVTEKGGQLRVIKNGVLLSTPFLTVTVDDDGERGLLGIAFDPNFASNQFVYVYYTATAPFIHNRISRFKANGDVKDSTVAEVILLDFDNLGSATNHNGGAIHFGPDGKLYAAHGENANAANSQTLGNLLGKIIRMNPVPASDPTQIPADNPFFSIASGKNRLIWALGLRNPFTFSFQPGTGLNFVNDVGAGAWEEINDARSGRNFGWPVTEGPFPPASHPELTNPLYSYQHNAGTPTGCAITGGAFYNPTIPRFPASYTGKYFFADLCGGWVYYIDPNSPATATQFAAGISGPVDLKVGPDGALYYLAINSGSVGKIQIKSNAPATSGDFDGDGKSEIAVFRPSNGTWYLRNTATPNQELVWGGGSDVPVGRDYDGDAKADIAVFRPSTGTWYIRYTATPTSAALVWGGVGDVPVPGDYDGDRKSDIAVFRPSTGTWYIRYSATPTSAALVWGGAGDVPFSVDFDGDGKSDIAVFRPSTGTWYIRYSFVPSAALVWGGGSDVPVPADFDGDGKAEIAVFRPSTGTWYIRYTATPTSAALVWGGGTDIPVPGDFDGDGKAEIAVFRPSSGTWYIRYTATPTSAALAWGGGSDIPILKRP